MAVLDASAVLAHLLRTHDLADHLGGGTAVAPHLIDPEVGHSLRRAARAGIISEPRARHALDDLAIAPMMRVPHSGLMARAWELRENFSFYDGLYVALAEVLETPLLTLDKRLARAGASHVELIVPVEDG